MTLEKRIEVLEKEVAALKVEVSKLPEKIVKQTLEKYIEIRESMAKGE